MKQFEPAGIIESMINASLPEDKRITVQPASEGVHSWFSGEIMRDGVMLKAVHVENWMTAPAIDMIKQCAAIAEELK